MSSCLKLSFGVLCMADLSQSDSRILLAHQYSMTNSSPDVHLAQQPPKPLIIKILLIFSCLQFALAAALLILQAVLKYIGIPGQVPLELASTCADAYTLSKYQAFLDQSITVRFISTCVSVLMGIILLILIIKSLASRPQNMVAMSEDSACMLYQFVGYMECRAWYILQSFNLLAIAVGFGFYLGLSIKGQSQCDWNQYKKTQILVFTVLGGVILLLALVAWVLILRIIFQRNSYQQKEEKYGQSSPQKRNNQDHSERRPLNTQQKPQNETYPTDNDQRKQQEMKEINRTPEKPSVWNIHPKQSQSQEKKQPAWSNLRPRESRGDDVNNYTPHRHQDNRQYLLDKYGDGEPQSYKRHQMYDNSPMQNIFSGKKESPPADPLRKSIYQRNDEPSSLNTGMSRFRSKQSPSYDRNISRNRLHEEEQSYLAENSNRKILAQGEYEGARPKLHSTYFRDETSMLKKNKFEDSRANEGRGGTRKGILTEYIQGRYAD